MADEFVLSRLAAALAPNLPGGAAQGSQPGQAQRTRLLIGSVQSATSGTPGLVDVSTDGVNTRVDVPTLVDVADGDVVWLLEQPPILVVIGVAATAWHHIGDGGEPAFVNNWANLNTASWYGAAFRRCGGRVELRGVVSSGDNPQAVPVVMFTLPAGYRPDRQVIEGAVCLGSGAGVADVRVSTNGDVIVQTATWTTNHPWVSLDGFSFSRSAP